MACSGEKIPTDNSNQEPEKEENPVQPEIETDPVMDLLVSLTLEEKVGQLFIVRPEALCTNMSESERNSTNKYGVKELTEEMIEVLKTYKPGGFILFGKNIIDPEQLTAFNKQLYDYSTIRPFISIDEEGGGTGRICFNNNFDVRRFSTMYEIGTSGDTEMAFEVGSTIGTYLKEYGFNTVFAPVADIFTNPNNRVIGRRSFGSDAETVTVMVSHCLDGFHSAGIMTTLKHFPGHGDTSNDTHRESVIVNKNWQELEECELIPFVENLGKTDLVMVAHITIEGSEDPCTLSYEAITEILRGKYHYDGLVITDSLSMGAITKNYSTADAAVAAFLAGNDILLMPAGLPEAFEAIKNAVNDGTISMERLNESVYRILSYKYKYLYEK